jgi:anaerobic magnesium-protoporphyrin IX monomethyl ester cyclase
MKRNSLHQFATLARRLIHRPKFHMVLTHYEREATYSLALAALSAAVKRKFGDVRVTYVPATKGDSVSAYVRSVRRLAPDVIAVSAMHPTWLPFLPYLEGLRGDCPQVPVVVGGYQAIFSSEETIAHPAVDYICVGEGERPITGLVSRLKGECANGNGSIDGLWEKREGQILKSNPTMTEAGHLHFFDYSIFERNGDLSWLSPHAVESKDLTTLPVMSGRGCPYRCSYCSNTSLLELYGGAKGFLRRFEIAPFISDLVRLKKRYGVEYFHFWDETFSFDRNYALTLMKEFRRRVDLPFSFFARVEQMSDEFCGEAAAAGCHAMWFGVESGSEEYRRQYLNRRMSNDAILEAAESARRHGIRRMTFNMIGMPFETRDDVVQTLDLTRRIGPELAVFSQFLPLPGTPLYQHSQRAGLLKEASEEQQMWTVGRLNIREQPTVMSEEEFQPLVAEILDYVVRHNRYDSG